MKRHASHAPLIAAAGAPIVHLFFFSREKEKKKENAPHTANRIRCTCTHIHPNFLQHLFTPEVTAIDMFLGGASSLVRFAICVFSP